MSPVASRWQRRETEIDEVGMIAFFGRARLSAENADVDPPD